MFTDELNYDLRSDSKLECGDDHDNDDESVCGTCDMCKLVFFWVQETSQRGHAKILTVRGEHNPLDLFTKAVRGKLREQSLKVLGFVKDRLSS